MCLKLFDGVFTADYADEERGADGAVPHLISESPAYISMALPNPNRYRIEKSSNLPLDVV